MLKTVYSALAVTALLAGTASFAADQTAAPAKAAAPVAPVAATASAVAPAAPVAATPAKETVKDGVKEKEAVKSSTHHAVKKDKEAVSTTETGATSTTKK